MGSIVLDKISKFFGNKVALRDVSISLHQNEITGLLGVNGAGKSTLMNIISGNMPASEGSSLIMGKSYPKDKLYLKKIIGYLPETNPQNGNLYVLESLNFIADIYGLSRREIEETLNLFNLEKHKHKKINTLSKGYRQRLGFAQAILNSPDILILDEPTNGLDPQQIQDIRKFILKFKENKTILLSSHLFQEIKAVCDRIVILHKGKLIFDDYLKNIDISLEKLFNDITNDESNETFAHSND